MYISVAVGTVLIDTTTSISEAKNKIGTALSASTANENLPKIVFGFINNPSIPADNATRVRNETLKKEKTTSALDFVKIKKPKNTNKPSIKKDIP